MSFFGPLIPLFWTSGDACPGFLNLREFSAICGGP